MKIVDLETFLVPPRWLFCRIATDEGVVGWGEATLEGRAAGVAATISTLSDLLVGANPLRIEDHWQVLTKGGFYRGGAVLASAVAGIDQALWDIAGKVRGVPVYELLGGPVREKARVYVWIGGDRPAAAAEAAAEKVEAGYTAVKMNGSADLTSIDTPARTREIIERVETVREAIGDGRDVAVDFHGRFSPAMARRVLPLLEAAHPLFVEEPVLPEHAHELRSLVEASNIPIAVGERLYSRWDFRSVVTSGIAVAQPDASHAGGISEVRRIAALAETYGVSIAPHCPIGPIALAASLAVDFSTSNFLIQEHGIDIHYNQGADMLDYLVDSSIFEHRDGYVGPPNGPGLGIEIDEHAVRRAAELGDSWRPPIWRTQDGAYAEW